MLPILSETPQFALKGGTAINLFFRDMPRLSVDIDLMYLPIGDRARSLKDIDDGLRKIAREVTHRLGYLVVQPNAGQITHLTIEGVVEEEFTRIKVEVSPVLRGGVHKPEHRRLVPAAENEFAFAESKVLAFEDLYGGKLCAALDRQHPRDLFDVSLLLEAEGISELLKNTFIIYLLSHGRPISELLAPNRLDISHVFDREFFAMTRVPVTIEALEVAREEMIGSLSRRLDIADRRFLLSFKSGKPNWEDFWYPQAQHLPAIQWKLHNINRMSRNARVQALDKLASVLDMN